MEQYLGCLWLSVKSRPLVWCLVVAIIVCVCGAFSALWCLRKTSRSEYLATGEMGATIGAIIDVESDQHSAAIIAGDQLVLCVERLGRFRSAGRFRCDAFEGRQLDIDKDVVVWSDGKHVWKKNIATIRENLKLSAADMLSRLVKYDPSARRSFVSAKASLIAISGVDTNVFRISDGSLAVELAGETEASISSDGQLLVTVRHQKQGAIVVRGIKEWQILAEWPLNKTQYTFVDCGEEADVVFVDEDAKYIRRMNGVSGKEICRWTLPCDITAVRAIRISHNGKWCVIGDKTGQLWCSSASRNDEWQRVFARPRVKWGITAVSRCNDGNEFLIGWYDGFVARVRVVCSGGAQD